MAVRSVVHVIAPDASGGGAESVIEALAAAAPQSTRVVILNQIAAADAPPHPFSEQLRARGIRTTEIRCGRRKYAAEVRALRDDLRSDAPAVVHTHGYHGDIVGFFAARALRLPIVGTVHGYIRRNYKEHLYNVVDRLLLRRFDAVVGVSPPIIEELLKSGIARRKVHLVRNGLKPPLRRLDRAEARSALGLPANASVIGWIGRLSPEKGPDLFVRAFADSPTSAHAVLIGEGAELERLNKLIAALPAAVQRRITLAGYRPDAGGLIAGFDVFALSSRSEGTPMVILEAVAGRIPIVAFKVGGIPDLLSADTAWLVDEGDVAAFAQALTEALSSQAESEQRATRARGALSDVLQSERWVERIAAVYQTVCAGRNGKS